MKKKLLVLLFSLATLGLASCGGSNDIAASGTSAVSAAATAPATTTPTTEPKVNGQVDERTGVAPLVAMMTVAPSCSDYEGFNVCGCGNSTNLGGSGETLTATQFTACSNALSAATSVNQCIALGGTCGQPYYACWGGLLVPGQLNCYAGTTGTN